MNLFSVLASGDFQLVNADSSGSPEIALSSWQLPELLEVVVIASPDGTTSTVPSNITTTTSTTDQSVPVPVVPDVC